MAFLAGLMLLDAPASALNNAGADTGTRDENAVATKVIRTRQGAFPYVSAQAFRYWLRITLEHTDGTEWRSAPVFREAKVAYTDGNPIMYWDDDLLGYMRAPREPEGREWATPLSPGQGQRQPVITRVSPFRVGTLVSLAPISVTTDFGTMSRHDGDPVPHEHQFYRTVLKGLFSLDLHAAGTFSYQSRTGFRNLDDIRRAQAEAYTGMEHLPDEQSYRLPPKERVQRIKALLKGIGLLAGGAKAALHYTDIVPAVILAAVMKGGNDPLYYAVGADERGLPVINMEAVKEIFRVWGDQMLSSLYVGWTHGFHDSQRSSLEQTLKQINPPQGYRIGHPREALDRIAADFSVEANLAWLR